MYNIFALFQTKPLHSTDYSLKGGLDARRSKSRLGLFCFPTDLAD
jgi:hypothetical protein